MINIIHMYPNLMNLYGDYANIAVLERLLREKGHEVSVCRLECGEQPSLPLEEYDFLYVGSGTEKSQRACMRDISRFSSSLSARTAAGKASLFTGNSHELLGRAVTSPEGERYDGLGFFDFETVQDNGRISGDCVCLAEFMDTKLIGFVNRSGGQLGMIDRPFAVEFGLGSGIGVATEGVSRGGLLGTYLTGPLLVRNPALLYRIADEICVSSLCADAETEAKTPENGRLWKYLNDAYDNALALLLNRAKNESPRG